MNLNVISFGCKVNKYEGQQIIECAKSLGLKITEDIRNCDYLIINSCAVTSNAEKDIKKLVKKIKKNSINTKIILTGCYTEPFKRILNEYSPEIEFVPQNEKENIFSLFGSTKKLPSRISEFYRAERIYIKLQDGCDSFCSYCIVPFLRRKIYSRAYRDIIQEIDILKEKGYNQFILTGIRLGKYNFKENGKIYNLEELLKIILSNFPNIKLWLSSIELTDITPRIIGLIAESNQIIKHLHIPLQSGSNRILTLMNRKYTSEEYIDTIEYIKSKIKKIAITTDIIVGFPTEDETSFNETLDVAKKCRFLKMHIFPYSVRPMTKAAELPQTTPPHKIRNFLERIHLLNRELQSEAIKHIDEELIKTGTRYLTV